MTEHQTTTATIPAKKPSGIFVQTDRATHEAWARLTIDAPKASALLHVLVNRVGEHNAVVASYPVLAQISGMSVSSVRRAIASLVAGNWIEVRRIGPSSTVNAYVINDRVAWTKARDDRRYSLFSATVIAEASEQEDKDTLDAARPPLHRLPKVGEMQMPAGPGLPPQAQPALPGLDSELPAWNAAEEEEAMLAEMLTSDDPTPER